MSGQRIGQIIFAAAVMATAAVQPSVAAERALAGIKIFSTAKTVLHKYGNPSQVIPGGTGVLSSGGVGVGGGGAPAGGGGGFPGAGGGPGAFGGGGAYGGAPGAFGGGAYGGGPGGSPAFGGGGVGLSIGGGPNKGGGPSAFGGGMGKGVDDGGDGGGFGAGAPAFGGGGAYGGGPGAMGGAARSGATLSGQQVTWIYDRPDGSSLEFTIGADGRVIQIRSTGYKGSVRTARGVALGQSYNKVLAAYGYPESQDLQGAILNANYSEKYHCAFQFYNQKLVGIVVAAVE